jgi:uncharacterized protein
MIYAFLIPHDQGVCMRLKVVPSSRVSRIAGIHGDCLKIRISESPEKGKANRELIIFLSEILSIPRQDIVILHGQGDAFKKVLLKNIGAASVAAILAPLII